LSEHQPGVMKSRLHARPHSGNLFFPRLAQRGIPAVHEVIDSRHHPASTHDISQRHWNQVPK
jgi:hypothetical protein